MKSFGAHVTLISKEDGGFKACVSKAKKMAEKENAFLVNQFVNKNNYLAHFETTGKEILNALNEEIYGFVSGIGTGGTLMGVSDSLKVKYPGLIVAAIEPAKMPMLSTECKEKLCSKLETTKISQHKIEGIGDDFIPDLLNKEKIDKIFLIDDDDAINMSRKFAKELGLGIGISSGANFLESVLLGKETNKAIVTVFADDNKKYLSTDLVKKIDKSDKLLSNKIKLLSYEVIK